MLKFRRIGSLITLCVFSTSVSWLRANVITFSNNTILTVSAGTASRAAPILADPYPSSIMVAGISDPLSNITVSLFGLSHTFPDDLGAVVVAPSGSSVLLFSGPGSGIAAENLNFVFDDNAAAPIPLSGALVSGTFQPGAEQWDDFYPAPGPGGKAADADPAPWNFSFASLLSENPNGQWDLFVIDSNSQDGGSISGGWAISFSTVPEPGSVCGLLAFGSTLFLRRRRTAN